MNMAMSTPSPDADDKPLDPEQARIIARVKRLMLFSGVATAVGLGVVVVLVGYRISKSGGSGPVVEATALLPKGARVVSTATAGDRLLVTMEVGGQIEIRSFDPQTMKATGRLRFATEP
jgi:hypothetical protein